MLIKSLLTASLRHSVLKSRVDHCRSDVESASQHACCSQPKTKEKVARTSHSIADARSTIALGVCAGARTTCTQQQLATEHPSLAVGFQEHALSGMVEWRWLTLN